MSRVIVIGGGLSGLMAAIEAANAGADVSVLQTGQGAHHLFSGCIDLLAFPEPHAPAVVNPITAIQQLTNENPSHPYAKVGGRIVVEAIERFLALTERGGVPYLGRGERQCHVPTTLGTLRPTALVPATMTVEPSAIDAMCNIGRFPNFSAGLAARELEKRTGRLIMVLDPPEMPGRGGLFAVAESWDDPDYLDSFSAFLRSEASGKVVAIPALLGMKNAMAVKMEIERRFGGTLVELPGLPPSWPGLRLFALLRRTANNLGARFMQGARVVAPIVRQNRLTGLKVKTGPIIREEFADDFVLATGHLISGGLTASRESLWEPIFNLPLSGQTEPPYFNKRFLTAIGHPVFGCGVAVDDQLRPVRDYRPFFENLFACGDILAGFDPYRERSGGGVALATGLLAGRLAARSGHAA